MVFIKKILYEEDIAAVSQLAIERFNKYKKRYVISKVYFILYLVSSLFVSVWGVLGNGFVDSIPLIVMFLLGLYVYVLIESEYKQTKILNSLFVDFIILENNKEYIITLDDSTLKINEDTEFNLKDFSAAIVIDEFVALTDGQAKTILIKCNLKEIAQIVKILKHNKINVFKLNKHH